MEAASVINASTPVHPLNATEFLAILDTQLQTCLEAKTPMKFDEGLTVAVLILQENAPNPVDAARAIAALVRGVLESAGCALPWHVTPRRRGGPARRARARSAAPSRARPGRRKPRRP